MILSNIDADNRSEKQKEEQRCLIEKRQKEKEEYDKNISGLIEHFGNCTVDINLGYWNEQNIKKRLLVFESSKTIIINGIEHPFSNILGFSLVDDVTSETILSSTGNSKTSTGSMIGRALVGGVLTGGLGAVAGAATARKNIATNTTSETITTHNYKIYINLNSLEYSTVIIPIGKNGDKAHKIANILNVIIERTKG